MRNRDSGSGGVAGVLLAAATVLSGWAITAGETAMVVGRVVAPIVTAGAPVTFVTGGARKDGNKDSKRVRDEGKVRSACACRAKGRAPEAGGIPPGVPASNQRYGARS